MAPWPTPPDYAETLPSGADLTPEETYVRAHTLPEQSLYGKAYRKRRSRAISRERQRMDQTTVEQRSDA